jgi:hypothetical protein
VIPFCAYNVLYRDGHVPLPPLRSAEENKKEEGTTDEHRRTQIKRL